MAENTEDQTEQNGGTQNQGGLVTKPNENAHPLVSEIQDADGSVYDIASKRFASPITVSLTGAVSGYATMSGNEPVTIATDIPAGTIDTDKLKNDAVTTAKIADGAVTLDKINDDAMSGNIATEPKDSDKLPTVSAVKQYVDDQVSGKGSYLGKKTVAEINALAASSLHNGDRVMVSDSGTIVYGEGKKSMTVREGEDLILYKLSDTDYQWQSMDGNFKIKGATLSKTMGGTEIITKIEQDANGDLTVTTGNITQASAADSGITKLYTTTGESTDGTMSQKAISEELAKCQGNLAFDGTYDADTNKVATVSSITTRLGNLDAEVTSTDGVNVQVKVTEENGVITAVNVSDASASAANLTKEIKDRTDADTALGKRIDDEETDRKTADTALGNRIDDETSAREEADSTLSDLISQEIKDRSGADDALGERIDDEIQDRADADTALGNRIDALEKDTHTHTDAQKAAMNSGVTESKVDSYDAHLANDDIHVTKTQKETWTAKQDAIADLDAIKAGAALGATSIQPGDPLSKLTDDITVDTYTGTSEYPISGKGVKAALDTLDATVTSTGGTNVEVKVTQTDGKITDVSITTDNTASSSELSAEATAREDADKALQDQIETKQEILDVEYDPDNQRLTFKNVTFSIAK